MFLVTDICKNFDKRFINNEVQIGACRNKTVQNLIKKNAELAIYPLLPVSNSRHSVIWKLAYFSSLLLI